MNPLLDERKSERLRLNHADTRAPSLAGAAGSCAVIVTLTAVTATDYVLPQELREPAELHLAPTSQAGPGPL